MQQGELSMLNMLTSRMSQRQCCAESYEAGSRSPIHGLSQAGARAPAGQVVGTTKLYSAHVHYWRHHHAVAAVQVPVRLRTPHLLRHGQHHAVR